VIIKALAILMKFFALFDQAHKRNKIILMIRKNEVIQEKHNKPGKQKSWLNRKLKI